MNEWIQLLGAFGGGIGFALIFGLHGKQIAVVAFGGVAVWGCYLSVQALGGGEMLSTFLATFFGGVATVLLSRVFKAPKTVFLFPLLLPLVPGSSLYLTMRLLLENDYHLCLTHAVKTLSVMLMMAVGIIVALVLEQAAVRITAAIKKGGEKKT